VYPRTPAPPPPASLPCASTPPHCSSLLLPKLEGRGYHGHCRWARPRQHSSVALQQRSWQWRLISLTCDQAAGLHSTEWHKEFTVGLSCNACM
jgi:hypothetical protein